ncbi:hypothetical protein [Hymenobacter algoricola]|uniref:Lipoprotein n=1 Tax=Hymenobacter algoricola TaxID=486267 RepID=A0ABP7NXN5_9BACT
MRNTITCLLAAATLLTTGCAGSYTPIRANRINTFSSVSAPNSPVEFSYQYSALMINGRNKKYNKKERKRGYQTVAVRIKNNTANDLNFSRDLELYFGDRPVMPVPAIQAANDLKQGVWIYLLYTPLAGTLGGSTDPRTGIVTGGTIFPWGLGVAAGNILGASQANKNLRMEFVTSEMVNKTIRPGETLSGIISLREMNVAPLHLVLRNSTALQAAPTPATPPASAPAQALPAGGQR